MLGIHFTLDYYTPANININQLSVLGPVLNLSFGYFVTIIGSRTAELFFFGTCVNKYYIFCYTMIEIANNWQIRKMPVSILNLEFLVLVSTISPTYSPYRNMIFHFFIGSQ